MGNLGSGSTGLGCVVDDDDGSDSETQDYDGKAKRYGLELEKDEGDPNVRISP